MPDIPFMPFMPTPFMPVPFMPTPFMPMPFMPTPFMPNLKPIMHGVSGVVLVLKLVAEASLPFVRGWLVEVSCDSWLVEVSCDGWLVEVSCDGWLR